MALGSNFYNDLKKEQSLSALLDVYYNDLLKNYTFKRLHDKTNQYAGVDVLFIDKTSGRTFCIDEKAQLDYVNENLPTFAFEVQYVHKEKIKKGWLFDTHKKTDFYALVTAIFADDPHSDCYTSCLITLVNRAKLLRYLQEKSLTEKCLQAYIAEHKEHHGKIRLGELNPRTEGYLYISKHNKCEQPVNLVLRLDFLERNAIAKKLSRD